jgi:methyl-accepting chemotaxis protein
VGEISGASGEQAQGIDQVNRAVSEMDKVVQKNAASAEESAAAAEELKGQAQCLEEYVNALAGMVAKRSSSSTRNREGSQIAAKTSKPKTPVGMALLPRSTKVDQSRVGMSCTTPVDTGRGRRHDVANRLDADLQDF